ncbi:MAG: DUF5916 domain-containing protein [Bacteroidota bacterium]|nr:DUF5916 domain-containing protein [Bacteroidota bacterium]
MFTGAAQSITRILALVPMLLATQHTLAQSASQYDPTSAPSALALRVEAAPTLDGDVLNDAAYNLALPIRSFWQNTPDAGSPVSEQTEVRMVYTDRALYIGVICYDRDPSGIIVSDSRRDAPLDETDSFQLILDTYLDGQNGFVFGTNPAGIEFDAQVTKEGQGGFGARQQSGSGGGFNINWDGSWDVQTRVHDQGWSAEFEIPFRTLRFPSGGAQVWGVNFQRNIRRRNEKAYWTRMPRQYNLHRVSRAGRLEGLTVPHPRNLQAVPYVLGQTARNYPEENSRFKQTGEFGLDLKYSLTPGLTLDGTYNTDFAQVEVDEQQINLDRFNLFFPEKRPFFLENAGLFSVGVSEFSGQEVELFFSRRIGIGPSGEAVPILGGTRLSGQVAGLNIGMLNMQTRSVKGAASSTNFSVARVRKDLPNRSSVGAMFTNRLHSAASGLPSAEYDNQAVAIDGRLGIGQYTQLSGFVARTFSPHLQGQEYAYNLNVAYLSNLWRINSTITQVADNFNPGIGFLRRNSEYRKYTGLVLYAWRPENSLGLLELRPHISYQAYWDFSGFQETGRWHIDNHWEWEGGFEIHTGINLTREGVHESFEISRDVHVDPGTYDHREAQLVLITNQGRKISLYARAVLGGFFGGSRENVRNTLRIRANESLTAEATLSHNNVRLPNGRFKANLIGARVSYSFTPRLYLQSLVQYNDVAEIWSVNLRFGWLQTANTGLFVVLNEVSEFGGHPSDRVLRSITLKYSRLFNVLR